MITRALSSDNIDLHRPIAHMVHRDPSAIGYSDSCLRAAGGFSIKMKFWWYIEWPECIQKRTLRYIKNNKNNMLISINLLEYAALLIEYVAATHYYRNGGTDDSDPYPTVLLYADNTTAEAWAKMKSCKTSMAGRALGRLQCALMINNHVGINIGHVTTKDNVIADRISRIKKETNTLPDFEKLLTTYLGGLLKHEFLLLLQMLFEQNIGKLTMSLKKTFKHDISKSIRYIFGKPTSFLNLKIL